MSAERTEKQQPAAPARQSSIRVRRSWGGRYSISWTILGASDQSHSKCSTTAERRSKVRTFAGASACSHSPALLPLLHAELYTNRRSCPAASNLHCPRWLSSSTFATHRPRAVVAAASARG